MNEIKPGQRWRARFDATVLTVIQRTADEQQWLAQNDADCLQEWYYTTQRSYTESSPGCRMTTLSS